MASPRLAAFATMGLAVAAVLLAGCTIDRAGVDAAEAIGGDPSLRDRPVLVVTSVRIEAGRCFDGNMPEHYECHELSVRHDNSRGLTDHSTGGYTWKAVDLEGELHSLEAMSSQNQVLEGEVAQLNISFTLPPESVRLVTLLYESGTAMANATIPSY